MKFLFRDAALIEAQQLFDWYEAQEAGLGGRLQSEYLDCLDRIRANPELKPSGFRRVRRWQIIPFPVEICYRIDDQVLTVLSVFHCKRNPRHWQRRA